MLKRLDRVISWSINEYRTYSTDHLPAEMPMAPHERSDQDGAIARIAANIG